MRPGVLVLLVLPSVLAGCASSRTASLAACTEPTGPPPDYVIGAGDVLDVFVWRNADLSTSEPVPVRPDGRINLPLVEDMLAVGKSPTALARDIEVVLSEYVIEPTVTVIVRSTGGASRVQIVGSVALPQGVPYREGVRVLDVVVAAGGLTEFAAGNRAMIVRASSADSIQCRVRLEDLIDDGDISQNVRLRAGDVIVVPESNF